jgi:hypothetical protein
MTARSLGKFDEKRAVIDRPTEDKFKLKHYRETRNFAMPIAALFGQNSDRDERQGKPQRNRDESKGTF